MFSNLVNTLYLLFMTPYWYNTIFVIDIIYLFFVSIVVSAADSVSVNT